MREHSYLRETKEESSCNGEIKCQCAKTVWRTILIVSVLTLFALLPSFAYASTAKVVVSVYMDYGGDGLVAIDDGASGYRVSGEYEVGSTVEIVAIPADGYTFDRFGRDELTTVSEDAHYTLTVKDGTNSLLAFFSKIPDAYDVVYSAGGGFGFMAPETVKAGGKLTLPKCGFLAPLGMEFDYWSVGGTAMEEGDSFTPGDDTTIVANWKPVSSGDWVTISFDSAGGQGTMDALIVLRGSDVILPECGFSHEGLSFAGWSAGLPGETVKAEQDTVIAAMWSEHELTVSEYTLTITLEGSGLGVGRWVEVTRDGKKMTGEPYTFRQGEEVTIRILSPSEEELADIDADGISFSPVLKSGDYFASFFMPDRDVNLVLSVQPKRCWILFNGGQALGHLDPVVATVGDKMTLPERFASTPGKRALSGWREVNGTYRGQPGDSYSVQGNVTLQAVWTVEDAHEHSLVKVDTVPATCETAGTETYWKCSGC
ncbi:MAG: InlB B-repeat-containing protein, partial [Eggerthellaceae bacterium]|nr:InlB B-repeat-containing protein [Eggerthellaceae bacterium]